MQNDLSHNFDEVRRLKDNPTESCPCTQLLTDKSIDEVSTHRRAEALYEIAEIFGVSLCPMLACLPTHVE